MKMERIRVELLPDMNIAFTTDTVTTHQSIGESVKLNFPLLVSLSVKISYLTQAHARDKLGCYSYLCALDNCSTYRVISM